MHQAEYQAQKEAVPKNGLERNKALILN